MEWAIFGAAVSVAAWVFNRLHHYFHLANSVPKDPLRGLPEEVIRKLAELEAEMPTEDEVSLAAVAWVKRMDSPPPANLVQGQWQQLLAPGLTEAYRRQQAMMMQQHCPSPEQQRAMMQAQMNTNRAGLNGFGLGLPPRKDQH